MKAAKVKALRLLFFAASVPERGTSAGAAIATTCLPVVRSTALFAHFRSLSGMAWLVACVLARIRRHVAISLLGNLEIISGRGSGIHLLAGLRGPNRLGITPYSLAVAVAFKRRRRWSHIFLANVRDDRSPLAFGTKGCSAADVPKVPQAW